MTAPSTTSKWKMRILVVEDQHDIATNMARLLQEAGHEVEIARDGEAAIRAVQVSPPDVILLDIGLPNLDGWQVAKQIQAQTFVKRPLLVAVTGHAQEEDRQRSKVAGIDLHLDKPVDPEKLRNLLQRFRGIISYD